MKPRLALPFAPRLLAMAATWLRGAVLLLASVWAPAALAAAYAFPGNLPAGCSGGGASYSCGSLSLAHGDTVTIGATKPITVTVNGSLDTSTSTINAGGAASDLNLIVTGTLTLGYSANIVATITAGSVSDPNGGVTITGTISTGSGNVTLGYATNVSGSITTGSGSITTGNTSVVGGNLSSTSGAITVGYNGQLGGSVSTAGAISLSQGAVVKGGIVGSTGNVDIGYQSSVAGTVTTSSGTISIGQGAVASSCVASTTPASITLGYQASVNGVCCGSSCGTSCVVNNSSFAMPGTCTPITHVASTGLSTVIPAATSLNLIVPSGTVPGDVLIAAIAQRQDNPWTAPSGWSIALVSNGTQQLSLDIWYRIATGVDIPGKAYTFTSGSTNDDAYGGMATYHGVDTSAPIAASGIQANSSSTSSATAPSVSPTVANTMLVAVWANRDKAITAPAGMTGDIGAPGTRKSGNVNLLSAHESRSASGATGTRVATEGGNTSSYGALLALRPGSGGAGSVDHYELSLPTASLACTPSTVTVTACTNTSSPCSSAATTLSGKTATLSTSGGSLGSTTVTFDATGVATTTLSYPAAANGASASVTLSNEQTSATNARKCCPNGTSCSAANSCSTTFSTAGFIVASAANGSAATLPAQTAGNASSTYYLRAVQTNTTTKACDAALSGAQNVGWAYQCNNPSTCSSGNLMTLTGSSATAIAGNPSSGVTSYTTVPMTFDSNGNAPFTFTFADVGQATLVASKTVNAATLSGSSNAFVTKPAGFTVAAIKQTASPFLANPGASSATGAKFVKAGESFSATVTAVTSGGAATPNFGRESSPEGVALSASLVSPAGGVAGTLSNGTIAGGSFSGGVATVTNLAYGEVGVVTLTPAVADGDYLGAGAVSGTTTGNVGRFVPASFALSSASVTHRSGQSCSPASTFTYLGENFRLGFTLTARNLAGATTQNYSGAYAKLDPTSAASFGLAGIAGSTVFSTAGGSPRLSLGSSTGGWSNGVASGITLTAAALRSTAPDGPFSAAFGIAPTDSDGVALGSYDLDTDSPANGNDRGTVGTVALRFGRLRLANAVGSQNASLALPVTAQSWTGSAFDTNTLDSCTSVAPAAVNFGNLRKTLTASDTTATGAVTIASGLGRLVLAKPASGRIGSVDVALSLGPSATDASCLQTWTPATGDAATAGANLSYLRGNWCGSTYDKDPSARATFGVYRGSDSVVYERENY